MSDHIIFKPGMSPSDIVRKTRSLPGIAITSTGMRDAGQSDFKNRLRIRDIESLAPHYDRMGLFSAEVHGGARWAGKRARLAQIGDRFAHRHPGA